MNDHTLTGLDGSNPLAFLATLGVLVALDAPDQRPRLSWRFTGTWTPVLHSHHPTFDAVVQALDADRHRAASDPALTFTYGDGVPDLKPSPAELHDTLASWAAVATPQRRATVDWFVGFVSEGALDGSGKSKPSALHFTAGQQKFLKAALELGQEAIAQDIRQALLGPWTYDSKAPVMGWDNTEARDYALRATNPASDKKLGNPGADWLALRGLQLLPNAAAAGRQRTACIKGGWKTGRLTWPLWTRPTSLSAVKALLVTPGLEDLPSEARARRHIGQLFQVRIHRSDQGGYGSVSPARPL